jgi:chromosome segregation ATPase
MMQLQQQMQKLRQENAQLQQGKAQEVEKVRDEAEKVKREASQLRASSSGSQREAKRLAEELAKVKEALQQSQAEADKLKAELAQRDAALQVAAQQLAGERRNADSAAGVLAARLKTNTARADVCEAKHESAMALGKEVIDRYEARQLRACEPFTGLWRLGEEQKIQALRDRLFESRLDVPAATASADAAK